MSTKPRIKAGDAVNDIRSGKTDSEMMEKYGLSAKGLHSLFLKLLEVKAETQSELNRRRASFHDTTMIRQMEPGNMAEDVRSGTSDSELMKKYGLSSEGLRRAFETLLEAKVITPDDLYGSSPPLPDTVFVENQREVPRCHFAVDVIIYEVRHPEFKGLLSNVAEKGIAVTGIEAEVGDRKTFIVPAVDFVQIDPIRFDAECKWAGKDSITGEWNSGFEIINISQKCLGDLGILVQSATFIG
jgi:uncharacterized protein (DUF433 family)